MKSVLIQPHDVLMFRRPMPFLAGGGAKSELPLPAVLLGALRTALGSKVGRWDQPGAEPFDLMGPWLHDEAIGQPLFPQPLALPVTRKDAQIRCHCLEPLREEASEGLAPLWKAGEQLGKVETNGFLTRDGLTDFLAAKAVKGWRAASDCHGLDERVGIAWEQGKKNVREGFLYSASFLALKPGIALVAATDAPLPTGPLTVRLGGEGRTATLTSVPGNVLPQPPKTLNEQRLLLYLATPAYFKHGWLPSFLDPATLCGRRDGLGLKLLAAATGKPVLVGGFDRRRGGPKPLRRMVPAGSCYFFEITDGEAAKSLCWHGSSFGDDPRADRENEPPPTGFGTGCIGTWNYCTVPAITLRG